VLASWVEETPEESQGLFLVGEELDRDQQPTDGLRIWAGDRRRLGVDEQRYGSKSGLDVLNRQSPRCGFPALPNPNVE